MLLLVLFIIFFICDLSRRLPDESYLPDFGAADFFFKDYDGGISVSLASDQPTAVQTVAR